MDRLDLAEIRAQLQSAADLEGRRARKPRPNPLAGLFRSRTPAAGARQAAPLPPPRRVGGPIDADLDTALELLLTEPAEAAAELDSGRRAAFGQRRERADATPPRQLPAPTPTLAPAVADEDVGEALRRLGSVLARAQAAPAETPYLPEDLSDHPAEDADRFLGAAGVMEAPPGPRRLALRAPPEPVVPLAPESELLAHLERVFLAERAGLEAHRLAA